MDFDRLSRPTEPRTSRAWLLIILLIGALFVTAGFISTSDEHPSPVRDTVLIAGGAILALTGAVGLRSPTYSVSGRAQISVSRLYAQLGIVLLALGLSSILLLGIGWDSVGWLLPGALALHRSWLLHRLTLAAREKELSPPPLK